MTQHTPGPWAVSRHGGITGGKWFEYTNGKAQQQIGMACVMEEGNGEQVANARLMAAAPNMLKALRLCRFDSLNMTINDWRFIQNTIAEAEGSE